MRPSPTISSSRPRACLAALIAASAGCASIPAGRATIDAVDVTGARAIAAGAITDKLATEATPKFLGLLRGVAYDYTVYDPSVLQRDMARVERYYRGRGFLSAHARVARVTRPRPGHVRVEIVVDEGPPTLDRAVRIDGLEGLPAEDAAAARLAAEAALPAGERFDEDRYKRAQATVLRAMTERGYAYARVRASARADLDAHAIDYAISVEPGIPAVFGPITFIGLDPDGSGPKPPVVGVAPLLRTIHLREGSPYSSAQIDAATQALLDLEIFSAVHIVPTLSDPGARAVPLLVEVQPANLRALKVGGGFEFDAIKTELHALVGWEDHDLFGGLRDFSVDFKPGVVLYPTAVGNFVLPERPLPEERLRVQLRVPAFIEARTTAFVRPELNVYPLLVEPAAENPNANVIGYVEPKVSVGVERRFGKRVFVSLAQNLQGEDPFAYKTSSSQPIPQAILLWFPELVTTLDLRDNPVRPHSGLYLSNDLQVAFGGTARDLRVAPEARGYVPLARGVTFGLRGAIGLVLSPTYGQYVQQDVQQRGAPSSAASQVLLDRDIETVYFRGFFSGGPSSNRGFPLRGVGPYGVVPFLNPATASTQVLTCNPGSATGCSMPIGGLTLWEASADVRFDVSGPLGIGVFCDASDVSAYVYDFRLDHPHVSCGAGVRYQTPVGPIRLDLAYRVPALQVLGYPNEAAAFHADPSNGLPGGRIFGQPVTAAFGIGEAF